MLEAGCSKPEHLENALTTGRVLAPGGRVGNNAEYQGGAVLQAVDVSTDERARVP